MNAIQQKCRPKHQVLVLKCYPKTTKGAVDIKPNSSELSYLLFYATSRRSKIQKIGQFLEKKTASDVWRVRIGNVQVTLQILAALIEKSPKDLPLFAPNVLKILGLILRSHDITMVEASLPTFETFCEHHNVSSLFADQAYLHQYEEVVRAYAACASTRVTPGKGTPSKSVALRWRNAGLGAIKSIASSDSLSSTFGRQIDVLVPKILENLWTDEEDFLDVLLQRAETEQNVDANGLVRRRTSVSTVKTTGTGGDTNPIAISGTSGDIDKLAEEDTGVEAIQCLKQIFVIPNRGQLQGATTALLRFIRERIQQKEVVMKPREGGRDGGWAIKIFDIVTRWAPVQDRYTIMVTAMEALLRTPPTKENVEEQIVLASIVGSLLRSDINLIGLSVIDVLLGLIQHMKRTLRHCAASRDGTTSGRSGDAELASDGLDEIPSQHLTLLSRVQQCMGDLATHVYYADQISDMISAVLSQFKPHPSAPENATAIERPSNPAGPTASTSNVSEEQAQLDGYFAKDLAKTTGLRAIRSILLVANPKSKLSGNVNLRRNRVPIHVWEGSHWLLRDPDGQVRKAYVDAVITWLDRETTRADLRARDEPVHDSPRRNNREVLPANTGRRAVSNTSNREKPATLPHSYFLLLLHLAIYDTALQYIDFDTDVALLHVLLTKLVTRLGVNAARFGLPMVFRLQEDIQEVDTPLSKVRLGCLCHGYFWAVSEQFDFETSVVGRAIQNEIARRRSKRFWVEGVNVPTPLLGSIGTPGLPGPEWKISIQEVESEALLPFDERSTMVDCICTNYRDYAASPPVSPATSPSRGITSPILSSTLSTFPPVDEQDELPAKFREEMLMEWTREAAIATIQEGTKSASLSGSKTGTTATRKNRLAANGRVVNGHSPSRPGSAYAGQNNLRPVSHAGTQGARKTSLQSRGSGKSNSSRGVVTSVEQLKSVLAGDPARPQTFKPVEEDDNSSSDSMVSYEAAPSELSFNPQMSEGNGSNETGQPQTRPKSSGAKSLNAGGGPLSSHPMDATDDEEGGDVPPVPPLPASFAGKSPEPDTGLEQAPGVSFQDGVLKSPRRSVKSREGESTFSSNFGNSDAAGTFDLQSLLKGIDSKSQQNTIGNLTRPPY
ncbi:hypothetical protein F4808DRAFT_35966 [Astrocystis sublimbata]|nr:hypothetical protein F4808DRAFT_35966 [Astrocystis sublimbata]